MITKTGATKFKEMYNVLSNASKKLLHGKKMFKSPEAIAAGMNEGSHRMAKQLGYHVLDIGKEIPLKEVVKTPAMAQGGGYFTGTWLRNDGVPVKFIQKMDPTNAAHRVVSPIHSVAGSEGKHKLMDAVAFRHEIHEAKSHKKLFENLDKEHAMLTNLGYPHNYLGRSAEVAGNNATAGIVGTKGRLFNKLHNKIRGVSGMGDRRILGNHNDLGVLGKESRDIALTGQGDGALKKLVKWRTNSGEREVVKRITGSDPFTSMLGKGQVKRLANTKAPVENGIKGHYVA